MNARLPASPVRPAPALAPPKPVRRAQGDEALAAPSNALLAAPADALLARWLVHDLAPMLGLDPRTVQVSSDAQAIARLDAHGASGLSAPGHIFLHPQRFQPGTVEGRYLLAHELVHAAQRTLPASPLPRSAAEEEARRIGRAFAIGHQVARPHIALAPDACAADTGAAAPTPALADSVRTSRSREIAQIQNFLSGWWISDGDVSNIMEILDSVAWPVARAMLMALRVTERYQLADNINQPHVLAHRRSVLVAYETLTPGQVGAVDLDVVRALQPGGMGAEEKDAASKLLRKLGDATRTKLLAEDRGPRLRSLIAAPASSELELARIADEEKQAAVDEAALANKRSTILAHANDGTVKDLLEQVRTIMAGSVDGSAAGDALAALDLLSTIRADPTRLAYIGEQMEQEGLVDQLLQLLHPSTFFDSPAHAATIAGLVQSRLAWKNARLVEDLLSYGLFDWAITGDEALFAFNIIKSLPLAEQLTFRRRDAGKWYLRLLDNLPDGQRRSGIEVRKADSLEEIASLEKEGVVVDKATALYNASDLYTRKLQETGTANALAGLVAAFKEARKGIYRDHEARALYLRLVALGGGSLVPGQEHPADQRLREAVVRELDGLGYIDELFGELPASFLYAEEYRVSTVQIMLAREPARVQNHARDLVSRGVTDWMVTDNEAWLAFMCVKALPGMERDDFIAAHKDLWGRVTSEMSAAQRQSRDLNAYIGDRAGVDRASVLGQLADAATWRAEQLLTLDGLLHMAVAMTEHRFAFERSKQFRAVQLAGLAALVEKYQLWNPAAGRTDYSPALLQGTRWHDEGPFAVLKTIGNLAVTLWNMDVLYVDGKVGARVDLNDVQKLLGGDVEGARLAKPAKKDAPGANTLSVLMGVDGKSAELILPELLIDTANMQFGGATLQTGTVTIRDLRLHASYDSEELGQPTQAHAILGSLVANDLLLASSGTMIAVARMALQTLRIAAGAVDTVTGASTAHRKPGAIPFPLLAIPVLAVLIVDYLPGYLSRAIGGYVDKFPGAVAQRARALEFSFASLSADGFTTSGGQQIGHVAVNDFALRVGLTRPARLRAERASIDQRLARLQGQDDKLLERRKAIDGELADTMLKEQEYLAIQAKILAGGLAAGEQATLQARLNALNFEETGAAYIDIGAIEASGVSGNITARDPIRLAGIHGEGSGNAIGGLATATDAEYSRRSGAGERPNAATESGNLLIEFGDVSTGEVSIGGGLRTVASIDAQLKDLAPQKDAPHMAPLLDSLQMLRVKADRYERMVQQGVGSLNQRQLNEFRALRQQLAAQADLVVKSIAMTRLTLDIDVASGRVKMGAGAATIAGIQMPAQGIEVDQVIVRGLGIGAIPNGGLLNWADWKKNFRAAEGKVDTLEVSGAHSRMHGLLFEKATLSGAYAAIKERGNVLTAGLARLQVTGVGVVPRLGLMRQRLHGLREKHKLATGAEQARLAGEIATLSAKVAELDQLAEARVAAYRRLQAAQTPADVTAAKEAVAETDMTIVIGLAQYGAAAVDLDEFGVEVSGAGDLLGDALNGGIDTDKVLGRGVRARGTGANGMLFRRFAVKGANTRSDSADASLEASGNMAIGETRLDVQAQRSGDTVAIDLAQLDIASFALSELLLTTDEGGNGMQVGSTGATSIEGLHLEGDATMVKRATVEGEGHFPGDFRMAHVAIRSLRIDRVTANGLLYRSIPDQIEATIQSGAIGGIWATGVTLDYPDAEGGKPVVLGSAGIGSITDLQVAGAIVDGMELQRGRLNGRDLRVDFLEEGALHASAGDFSATAMALRGPDGWARFSLNHLSGAVDMKNGVITLDQVRLGSLEVPAVHWRAGTRTIDADKPARLVDLRISAEVRTHQDKAPGQKDGKTVIDSLKVRELYVGAVTAEHLLYRDGADEVEIGAPAADVTEAMRSFRPLAITDIRVEHLEWDPAKGVGGNKLEADVGGFEAAAVYRNVKDGVRAGMALKGSKMGMSFIGPNFIVGNTGIIAKTAGFYHDKSVDTRFSTGQIFGSYTLTDKGITINNLDIDKVAIGETSYWSPDMEVKLGGAGVAHLSIDSVEVDLEKGVDADAKPTSKLREVRVRDIGMTGVHADTFHYKGRANSVNAKGEKVSKDTDLRADHAWLDRFRIHTLRHDVANKLTTVERAAIDNRRGGNPAFGVKGLIANIATTIGSKSTAVRLATDVEGSALTGQDISFQSVSLGDNVTRSAIGGKFQLSTLALWHPKVTLTNDKGERTLIHESDVPGGSSLIINGLHPTFMPNGTVVIPFNSLLARNFVIEQSGMMLSLPLLKLHDFAMALKGGGSKEGYSLLAARLKELSVHDVRLDMTIDRARKSAADDTAPAKPGPAFFAEPIGNMTGELRGEYNTLWDPNVVLPIRGGKLNFEDVHPYALNLSDGHLAVGNIRIIEKNVAEVPMMPGMHPEQGAYGVIDFREMLEHMFNDPAPAPDPNKKSAPADLSFLNKLKLGGYLQMGNGAIGAGGTSAQLERQRPTDNRIDIAWAKVGDRVTVTLDRLRASHMKIAGGADFPSGQTGEATVSGIDIQVSGLADMRFTITVTVKEGKIVDVQFGDLRVFNQDAKGNYPAMQDVNPPTLEEARADPVGATP